MAVVAANVVRPDLHKEIAKWRGQAGVSDLHIIPDRSAFVRRDGDNGESFDAPTMDQMMGFIKEIASAEQIAAFNDPQKLTAIRAGHSDDAYGRIRLQAKQHHFGLKVAIRYLQDSPPALHELDLPAILPEWMHRDSGLILFCGRTGDGKTTNQSALIHYALAKRNPHVITLENPVEYLYDDDRVTMRELGRHFVTFAQGIYDAMADDPDIIMMGEILDRLTAEAVLQAVESGHLVLATVHTNGTMHAADRIVSMFPPGERDMARMILSQQLIGCCGSKLVKKKGGGRRAAVEILVRTPAVTGAIVRGDTKAIRDCITNTREVGMMSLEQHLTKLAKDTPPQISHSEAKANAEFPDEVKI